MNVSPAMLPVAPLETAREPSRPLRYLILRAHPGRSRADFYNCQELGLAAFLRKQGIEVGVAGVFDDDAGELEAGVTIHTLKFWPQHPAFALVANLPDLNLPSYDIVQLSDLCLPANLQIMLQAQRGTRFLLYQGHYPEPLGRARWLRIWQSRLAAKALRSRPHALLAKSGAAAEFLARCGLSSAPVAGVGLVASHLLAPQSPPAPVLEFIERSAFTFLYVGQLHERRPLQWVLPHLRDPEMAHASLLVVGSGPSLAELRDASADLIAAGRVLFVGNLNQSQLGVLYRRVDAHVLPTRFEIFGMVCLEAVLFNLPVIASDVAGPAAVASRFPGQVQLVAQGRNPAGWREALVAAARRPRTYSPAAPDPDMVSALSWDTPGQYFLHAISQLLATSASLRRPMGRRHA
jgi:glycosyltransferase involved in cell wall biosynthesis